jgi:probable F420-dependent oxidoreductase
MAGENQVKFGIAIPQMFTQLPVDTSLIQRFLVRAESLGYHSAWVQEQILGSAASLEPVGLLTYAAALTSRIRLGSAVLLTPLRNPVQLAKSLSALDQLSGGRLIVGVGLGASTRIYPAFGLSAEQRVRRFTEGILLMKRLWTEERVTFDGEFWKLQNASMQPKPVQKPHPPLWFGAHHDAALKRAVELGDGWIGAGSRTTAQMREEARKLSGYLAEARRDPATFSMAKRVYIAVDQNKARAEKRLSEWFGWYYRGADLAARVAVYGDQRECTEKLAEIVEAGARLLILNPVFDVLEHLELFAEAFFSALCTRQ